MMHYNCVSEALHDHHRSYYHSPETGRIIAKEHHPSACPVELPCYGYEPTCWRRWPEECVGCPPDEEVIHHGTIVEQPAAPIVPTHSALKQPTPASQQPAPVIMPESPADDVAVPADDVEAPADIDTRVPVDEVPAPDEGADVPLPDDSALPGASNQPVRQAEPGPVAVRSIQRLDDAVPLNDVPMALAAAGDAVEARVNEMKAEAEEVFESAIQARLNTTQPVAIQVEDIEEPAAPQVVAVEKQAEPVAAEPAANDGADEVAALEEASEETTTMVLADPREPARSVPVADVPATETIAENVEASFVEKQAPTSVEPVTEVVEVAGNLPLAAEDKSVSQKDEDPNAAMVDAVDSEEEVREVPKFKIAAVLPSAPQANETASENTSSVRLQVNGPATIRFVNKRTQEMVQPVAKKPTTSGIRFR